MTRTEREEALIFAKAFIDGVMEPMLPASVDLSERVAMIQSIADYVLNDIEPYSAVVPENGSQS